MHQNKFNAIVQKKKKQYNNNLIFFQKYFISKIFKILDLYFSFEINYMSIYFNIFAILHFFIGSTFEVFKTHI